MPREKELPDLRGVGKTVLLDRMREGAEEGSALAGFRDPGVLAVGIGAAEDDPFESVIVVYFDRSRVAYVPPVIDGFRTRVNITDPIVAQ